MKMLFADEQFDYLLKKCRDIEDPAGADSHHVDRVGNLSHKIASALGLNPELAWQLGLAARIHDIGKTLIRPDILGKPGRLSLTEFELVQKHTIIGEAIISALDNDLVFDLAGKIALSHHERWDGSGYPHGLRGKDIPISARIAAVADNLDALTHKRQYKDAWPAEAVMKFLVRESGKRFDPEIIRIIAARLYEFLPHTKNDSFQGEDRG